MVGVAVSSGKATLHELQTVYSLGDLFLIIEVIQIDNYNLKMASKSNDNSRQICIRT
ncbi:hypothetical protein RCS94_06430 [Orbaceae bacterium ac157xtp]